MNYRDEEAIVQDEVIGQSAMLFFVVFTIVYLIPDADFRRRASSLIVTFTLLRVLLKFSIFIPHKEEMARNALRTRQGRMAPKPVGF